MLKVRLPTTVACIVSVAVLGIRRVLAEACSSGLAPGVLATVPGPVVMPVAGRLWRVLHLMFLQQVVTVAMWVVWVVGGCRTMPPCASVCIYSSV